MLENGTIIGNRYEIIGKIGTGGTADVYKAKCHKLNRYVAIKVLKREFSEDRNFISKFRIEAQSAAGMAHANIVNVYDVGDENGIYYIVMELVEGITLKQYIDKKGALEYKEAVSIAIQIAQGIEAAHRHNIIHRDIKPQNIIISREGKVKVTDFGIAKVTNTDTVNSMAMGSVHYISPEQARSGFSDITSDIYSFGITLYEMCTGRVPFDGETTVSVALMHIQNEIVPPSVYNPSIPVSVESIILKCTQKRMDKRYQSATEVIADLKRSLITPYENFVVMPEAVDHSPTVLFTPDELSQIQTRTQNSQSTQTMPGGPVPFGIMDPQDDLGPDMELVTGNSIDLTHIYDENDFEEHHYVEHEEEEEDEDETVMRDGNKIDKIMVWLGIAVAVVIVIITIAVVFRVLVTFNGIGSDKEQQETTTQTPTVAIDQGVEVPGLIGLTAKEAQEALNERRLGFKQVTAESDVIAKGYVMAQSVDEGVHVEENTQIVVTVSSGPKTFELVDVLSLTEEKASAMLKELDLNPVIEYEFSNDKEQGVVMKTVPVAGSQVKAGDTITVTVSRGKQNQECVVPNLLNMDESQAREAIDKAGLVAQLGGTVSSSTIETGKVVAQNYPEGTKLAAGTIVEYILSSGSSSKSYTGRMVVIKAWATAEPAPEGFVEDGGKREVQVVFRQEKDGTSMSKEILPFTDVNDIMDEHEILFTGIAEGVKDGNAEVYVRYTWKDAVTGEPRIVTKSVQTLYVELSEAVTQ